VSHISEIDNRVTASWAPKRAQEAAEHRDRKMGESSVRILCAQGSPPADRTLPDSLRDAGFSVRHAATADEVLRFGNDGAELIVLEDSLPDRSALDVVRQLKSAPSSTSVPVLFLEGRHEFSGRNVEEADGYLTANAEPAEVLAWIRFLLRRKDSLRMESLGRLTSGIAHDFNNLLTVMHGHLDLLGECVPAVGPAQEMLDALRRTAACAAQLSSQMLSLARQQPLTPQLVDLGSLMTEVVSALRRVFGSRIEIVVQRTPNVPPLRAVSCQLTQVLLNLCLNARDAMPNGGRLTLTTEAIDLDRGTFVRLRVSDTGGGIPSDLLAHIFEPYFTTRPGHGSGLGLSTVDRIVRAHQGWITCSSEPGRGSTFDLFFPAG
jgi:signal transduction histidine kinase